jgi:polyisoprenoid-binding protein YceI
MPSHPILQFTLATAVAAVMLPAAIAQAKPARLLAAGSEIAFTTRQMGVPVEGRFGRYGAQITLDPKKPETGSVSFTIDTGSARFGSPELDAEVPKPTWLSAVKFPQASFRSTAIKAAGPGRYAVAGTLTIKGSAREITVPVQLTQSGATSIASGAFTIKRLEFKVGEDEWADTSMLANDVQVRFKLALTGLPPP